MDLDKAIKSRESVRKFKGKQPDWRDILECIDAVRYAPIAGKNFTMRFIVISDKEKIEKIAEASQQNFFSNVYYLVVVISNSERLVNEFGERGKIYSRQQAGAAIQNFLLKVEEKGLSTCWVGHFVEKQIKEALSIPPEFDVEAFFPIGYKLIGERKKKRIDMDEVLYFEKHGNKKMRDVPRFDV